jgi:hypothetical protein
VNLDTPRIARTLREAGTAVWIGGQLFGVVALPAATHTITRPRDRHRAAVAAWTAWTPIAYAALGVALVGSLLERRPRCGLRVGATLLALTSTTAAALLSARFERGGFLPGDPDVFDRNEAGHPVALRLYGQLLRRKMLPLNIVHGLAAGGMIAN